MNDIALQIEKITMFLCSREEKKRRNRRSGIIYVWGSGRKNYNIIEYFHGEIHDARLIRTRSRSFVTTLFTKGGRRGGNKEEINGKERKGGDKLRQRFVTSAVADKAVDGTAWTWTSHCRARKKRTFTSGGSTRRRANDLLTHRTVHLLVTDRRDWWWPGKAVH